MGLIELAPPHRLVFDGFVAKADVEAAVATATPAARGAWNAGYAHGHTFAWWAGPGTWRCVDAQGRPIAVLEAGVLRLRGQEIAASDVDCVELFVAPGWELRGVRVCPFDDAAVEVVRDEDATPAVDPAYDVESLEMDVVWLGAMATSLAAALARPSFRRISPR